MNIGIIGTGGVGGYFGGKIAKRFENDSEHKVFFLARGEHLKKIKERGLILNEDKEKSVCCKPFLATDNIADFPVLDVCMICVKAYDLKNVLEQLKTKITKNTEIIPLLNGVDIPKRINKVITDSSIYPSCVYIGTHIKEPGVIEQSGKKGKIITGPLNSDNISVKPSILKVFEESGIDYEWTDKNYEAIWTKYMCVAPYSIVCAYYDKTMGQVYHDADLSSKVLNIGELILKIADKEGIKLPESYPRESMEKAADYPMDLKTSFHRDFERKGRKNEKETFVDALLELAEKYDLDSSCVVDVVNRIES